MTRILALLSTSVIFLASFSAFAAEGDKTEAATDEASLLRTCMTHKYQDRNPPIPKAKMDSCLKGDASALSKCLGIKDAEYKSYKLACDTQIESAKCVAEEMKVPLDKYSSCGYSKNPEVCFKALGYSMEDIVRFSEGCQKPQP